MQEFAHVVIGTREDQTHVEAVFSSENRDRNSFMWDLDILCLDDAYGQGLG